MAIKPVPSIDIKSPLKVEELIKENVSDYIVPELDKKIFLGALLSFILIILVSGLFLFIFYSGRY